MYGDVYEKDSKNMSSVTSAIVYGNDVTYSNGTYTLVTTKSSTSWSTDRKTLADGYHYTCFNETGTCSSVYYITYFGNTNASYANYLTFTEGDNLDSAKEKMFTNTNDSIIKTYIDNWYSENLTNYTDMLENTIFCNDRTFASGTTYYTSSLSSKDTNSTSDSYFKSNENVIKGTPSLQCESQNDRFSLSTTNGGTNGYGNNALTYPVGLLTLDEANLSGGKSNLNSNYYLHTGSKFWFLSPAFWFSGVASTVGYMGSNGLLDYNNVSNGTGFGARPVVSLQLGTEFEEGTDGTVNNPYKVVTN